MSRHLHPAKLLPTPYRPVPYCAASLRRGLVERYRTLACGRWPRRQGCRSRSSRQPRSLARGTGRSHTRTRASRTPCRGASRPWTTGSRLHFLPGSWTPLYCRFVPPWWREACSRALVSGQQDGGKKHGTMATSLRSAGPRRSRGPARRLGRRGWILHSRIRSRGTIED
jgi:hypothetical protein